MKRLLLLYLILISSFSHLVNAQTARGADVYYQKIGATKYKVTAVLYRNCASGTLTQLKGDVISDTFKIPINYVRTSITRLDSGCGNPCQNKNQYSNKGVERHVFEDSIDFSVAPYNQIPNHSLCEVYFSISQKLKDTSITTMSFANGNFYIDAMTNICLDVGNNNSPTFSFDPKLESVCNIPFTYTPGAIDTFEYDSFSYELSTPLYDFQKKINYGSQFTYYIPLSPYCPPSPGKIDCRPIPSARPPRGFYFDKETGEIIVATTKCDEVSVIKYIVREWRKDSTGRPYSLGYVSREMVLYVKQSYNNSALLTPLAKKYIVCENETLNINFSTMDYSIQPNGPKDTTYFEWNHALPGAKGLLGGKLNYTDSNAREKAGQLEWKAFNVNNNNLYHQFGIRTWDFKCNIFMNTYGFIVKVNSFPKAKFIVKPTSCSNYSIVSKATDTNNFPNSTFRYKHNLYAINDSLVLYNSINANDSFKLTKNGTYVIEHLVSVVGNSCENKYYDTITHQTERNKILNLNPKYFCKGDSIHLSILPQLPNTAYATWETVNEYGKKHDTTLTINRILISKLDKIYLKSHHNDHCDHKDTLHIHTGANFSFASSVKPLKVCKGDTFTVFAKKVYGTPPYQHTWFVDNKFYTQKEKLHTRLFTENSLIRLVLRDSLCTSEDSIKVQSLSTKIDLNDTVVCKGTMSQIIPQYLTNKNITKYEWWMNGLKTNENGSVFNETFTNKTTLNLYITNSNNCQTNANVNVDVMDFEKVKILSDSIFNHKHIVKMTTNKDFKNYQWSNGGSTKNNEFWAYTLGAPGTYSIICEVQDSNTCKSRDTFQIRTDGFTSLSDIQSLKTEIYPNPFANKIQINLKKTTEVKVWDINGKLLIHKTLNDGIQTIETENWIPGTYYLMIGSEGYTMIKK